MSDVIATLHPSPVRRAVGVAGLLAFGAAFVWIALAEPPASLTGRLGALIAGIAALVLADRMRRATSVRLELTAEELREAGGRTLARVDQIRAVERGAFALKPAAGFRIHLRAAGEAAWAPGLWWRLGRSVGVGGVTGKTEARIMAEAISSLIGEPRR